MSHPNHHKPSIKPPDESPKEETARKLTIDIRSFPLPLFLDTPEMRTALQEWAEHRKEIERPLTERALKLQIKELEKLGPETAVAAFYYSIRRGWRDIFEAKEVPPEKRVAPAAPVVSTKDKIKKLYANLPPSVRAELDVERKEALAK